MHHHSASRAGEQGNADRSPGHGEARGREGERDGSISQRITLYLQECDRICWRVEPPSLAFVPDNGRPGWPSKAHLRHLEAEISRRCGAAAHQTKAMFLNFAETVYPLSRAVQNLTQPEINKKIKRKRSLLALRFDLVPEAGAMAPVKRMEALKKQLGEVEQQVRAAAST